MKLILRSKTPEHQISLAVQLTGAGRRSKGLRREVPAGIRARGNFVSFHQVKSRFFQAPLPAAAHQNLAKVILDDPVQMRESASRMLTVTPLGQKVLGSSRLHPVEISGHALG